MAKQKFRPKLPKDRDRHLEPGEEELLLGALRITLKPLFQIALKTAMRQGELLSLEWKNINLTRRVAYLSEIKNSEAREVPLSSKAVAVRCKLPRRIADMTCATRHVHGYLKRG
ncbi:MAG: tyrosine-type recombinase/integrase [Desulfuromusa sp.]